jgi:hypothetical protein
MIIEIDLPDTLPEGHGASFKKGIAEILLKSAMTPIDHTPNGHELSRKLGEDVGNLLAQEIANIVKKPQS